MKLILWKIPFIRYDTWLVVKFAKSLHQIIFPISKKAKFIIQIKFALAFFFSIQFVPFISLSLWVVIDGEYWLI